MNSTLETIRGSWPTKDREIAEANRRFLRSCIEEIPFELREQFLSALEWAETTERWDEIIIENTVKQSAYDFEEMQVIEQEIKTLIEAIRSTRDVDSIKALRATTREVVERMNERRHQQETKRLEESVKMRALVADKKGLSVP